MSRVGHRVADSRLLPEVYPARFDRHVPTAQSRLTKLRPRGAGPEAWKQPTGSASTSRSSNEGPGLTIARMRPRPRFVD